jgi:flagellar protein FliO/FliZ
MTVLALQLAAPASDVAAGGLVSLRSVAAFVIVGVLLAAAVWGLTRMNALKRGTATLAVESALSLGEKRSLVIVTVEGRRLLLGVSPGSISLVSELGPAFAKTLDASLDRALDAGPRP